MQMTIKTKGFDSVSALLKPERILTATRRALNDTAYALRNEYSKAMPQIFNKPTGFIQRAFFSQLQSDKLTATVGIKDNAAKILRPHIIGGGRSMKRSEYQLHGMYYTPGDVLTSGNFAGGLDQYGNVKGSYMNQLLSHLKLRRGGIGNRKKASPYFLLTQRKGSLIPGVYWGYTANKRRRVVPVLMLHRTVTYTKRFMFDDMAKSFVPRYYKAQLLSNLAKYLK